MNNENQIGIDQSLFFSSVFWKTNLSTVVDNQQLIDYAYELYDTDIGLKISNRLGFHSNNINLNEDEIDPRYQTLSKEIQGICFNIVSEKLFTSIENKIFYTESWVNINQKYSYNTQHMHGGNSLLSVVYYAQVPQDSGNFYFVDNNSYVDKIATFQLDKFPGFGTKISFLPQPGDVIIFPSWIYHGVEQNLSEQDRISFAFNINCKIDYAKNDLLEKDKLNNGLAY